jgi:hypothetical protein
MAAFNKNKRKLHDRSHLTLEFPQSNDRVIRTYIPFLENPIISEKGSANLNSYNLVGRAGELFAYGGAQSRRLTVTFNISLLHVMEVDSEEGIADHFKRQFQLYFTSEDAKNAFKLRKEERKKEEETRDIRLGEGIFDPQDFDILGGQGAVEGSEYDFAISQNDETTGALGRQHAARHRAYYRRIAGLVQGDPEVEGEDFSNILRGDAEIKQSQLQRENNKHIDLVYCWLNLIRASVLNRSDNTVYGPPIVRLTHGPMYGNVPCLVENYSVKVLEEAGYEAQTLTPKRIQVSLSLVESRTGDFGKYVGGQIIAGDNLTGWESIISNNEIDPYNGGVSDYAVL